MIVAGQKSRFHSDRMIRFANHPALVGMTGSSVRRERHPSTSSGQAMNRALTQLFGDKNQKPPGSLPELGDCQLVRHLSREIVTRKSLH
jgi:hypothetical protein